MSSLVLLLQLIVILATARACGWLLRFVGQPQVVGEMAAGLVLGPVVAGTLFPAWHAQLFSHERLGGLNALATLGLVLFMFIVGVEIRAPGGLRGAARCGGPIGALGVFVPVVLTLAIAPAIHPLAPAGLGFWPFAIYLSSAVAITAFPVMARILKDRGMTHTRFGQAALAGAAVADVFAWVLLAAVVAMVGAAASGVARMLVGLAALLAVLYLVARPLLARLLATREHDDALPGAALAALMVGLFASAAATEWLHLHAVFGAFLFGAALPRDDRLMHGLVQRVEPVAIVVLMPLFFALAGLSTTRSAFVGGAFGAMLVVVGVATVGKLAGGALGARLAGLGPRDSLAVGALLNARGLMELIVMKVGLDAGLIGPELFTILLVMALATTAMASPLVTLSLSFGRTSKFGARA